MLDMRIEQFLTLKRLKPICARIFNVLNKLKQKIWHFYY